MVEVERSRRLGTREDRGAILALWVLCLSVLMGCMALAINLGNLQQQAVNVQDAADSAALAGAQMLAQPQSLNDLVQQYVPIPPGLCSVTSLGSWLTCKKFNWLDGYYLYDNQEPPGANCPGIICTGWWQIVPATGHLGPGQITDSQAFQDAASPAGPWQCAWYQPGKQLQHYHCGELYTGVGNPQANWDLSAPANPAATSTNPALTATDIAVETTAEYGLAPDWSACPTSLPQPLFLAEGWNGTTCLAYEITGNAPHQNVIFWARLDVHGIWRTAWATASPARLCSGLPSEGNCN